MTSRPPPLLSPLEARVLGVLVEKRITVPDTYPLSLNALVMGCNQKSSRHPLMQATEAEVQNALDQLKRLSLVIESSGSRTMRFAENVRAVLDVPTPSVALLAVLALRGPQTAGELRINCERLQHFSDISAVTGFLEELAGRGAGPLVVQLPRQPGARENRWMHLLSGEAAARADTGAPAGDAVATPEGGRHTAGEAERAGPIDLGPGELAATQARLARLEDEVASLRAAVDRLCSELGMH